MTPALLAVYLSVAARLDSPVTERAEALARVALQRGAEPRGAAALIRLRALEDEVDDLNLLAEPFAAVATRGTTHPLVRTLARSFWADVERARGKTVRAAELVADTGFVQDFQVVGSFDNEGKGGCDTDFGPEAALNLDATYPAKGREVGWRTVGAKAPSGLVDLSLSLRPQNDAVAYAYTLLVAEAETRAVLSVGAPGAFRLFVNGVKVAQGDRYNQARADQARVEVSLRKGNNRVLLKVCQESALLAFAFRTERAEGAKGAFKAVLPTSVPPLEKGPAPAPKVLPTLADLLAKEVKERPKDFELRADEATVLGFLKTDDERDHLAASEAQAAADLQPGDADLQVTAASLSTEDLNAKKRLLERALKASPKHPWARLRLGELELSREHPEVALKLAESLASDFPRFAPAVVLKVRALESLGERAQAHLVVEDAFARLAVLPSIAREGMAQSRRFDRLEEAMARARTVLALRFDDVGTRRTLGTMLLDAGHPEEAVEQLKKALAADPFDQGSLLRVAEVLAMNGAADKALVAFAEARRLAPDEPEVFEKEGRALLHLGKKDEALKGFMQSLALRPQNPALKEMVRTLRGDDSAVSPWAMATAPLLAEAKELKEASGEDAVVLADVAASRVQTSGLSSRFNQVVVKVLTQRGVDAWRQMPITYSPDRQEVRILKARIVKPDQSVVDSYGDQDRNINEPWTGMYYDARARVLTFPALAPGDVLEVQWRLEDTSIDNLLSDYWGDVDLVQGLTPKKHYLFVVDMPKTRPLQWNASSLPKWLVPEQTTDAERTVTVFRAHDVPKVVPEPSMPGWSEVGTPLHVSTYKAWEDVGRFYWGLVRDQLVPNDELKKTVEGLIKGIDPKDTAKLVAAIYDFVVTNTRYVALEFGIHGYKPYPVTKVLSRRFGDCKDKASLIHAMLKVAGVDSRLVLLRMRHLGGLSSEPASLAAFNHAIAYVPSLDLYLDGTAEFHGSKELPSADRMANVLVIEPDGNSRFLTTPEAKPLDNLTTLSLDATLKADGSAAVSGSLVVQGQAAPELRRVYEAQATRQAMFEQQFAQAYPGLAATTVTMSDPKALEQPASLGFAMAVPRMAESTSERLRFFPFGSSRAFTQSLAPLSERTWDVVLSGPWVNRFHTAWTLPANASVEPPPEVVEESPFGSLHITVKKGEKGVLDVSGELVLTRARITPKEYPEFRSWLLRVDQAFGRKLEAKLLPKSARR